MSSLFFDKKLSKARQLVQQRNHAEALKLYARLAKQSPHSSLWVEYGHATLVSGDLDSAERIWEKACTLEPKGAAVLGQIALEYRKSGLHGKAATFYAEAAESEPANLEAQLLQASYLSEIGGAAPARKAVKSALKLDAKNEQARFLLAQLNRRENKLEDAEKQLRELLAGGVKDVQLRSSCHFELAQILDRKGSFDEAMAALNEGKTIVRRTVNVEAELAGLDQWHDIITKITQSLPKNVLEVWSKAFPERARSVSVSPVFLGGPVRSGATLLEKMLDAHPSVAAGDELRAFPDTVALTDFSTPNIPAQRLNILRERYLKMFSKSLGAPLDGKILLDKNPQPTLFLPAFLRVFPELRVIIAIRDPRDAILSLYFRNQKNANFISLEHLAKHYSRIMELWFTIREWEGLAWTESRYEDLVADLPKEGARATKFLGLDWHKDQSNFHKKNGDKPIMAFNYDDVSQPIYRRSVGRWKSYEKHLAPILPVLEPYCKKLGYA